ncbi:phosphotransferase [Planctomycetaceae bacterium SH139]
MSIMSVAEPAMVWEDRPLIGLSQCLQGKQIAAVLANEPSRLGSTADRQILLQYIRYKPRRRCLTVHRLMPTGNSVRESASPARATQQEGLLVAKALTKEGFLKQQQILQRLSGNCLSWLADPMLQLILLRFPLDPRLDAVRKVYDPQAQNRVLRRVVGGKHGWRLQAMRSLAYKPERRFVAGLRDSEGFERTIKFHSADRFADAVKRLQLLADSRLPSPKLMHVCERYRAVCLDYLPGTSLTVLLAGSGGVHDIAELVGSELAQLHQQPLASSWSRIVAIRPERLTELADTMRVLSPALSVRTAEIVTRVLHRLESTRGETTLCHGDFYAKQILVDQGDVHFIDFDQVGPDDRYRDVANFVAQLHWRERAGDFGFPRLQAVSESFLAGYRRVFLRFDEERYQAQLAAALLRCAMHPFRNAMPDWQAGIEALLEQANAVVTGERPKGHFSSDIDDLD